MDVEVFDADLAAVGVEFSGQELGESGCPFPDRGERAAIEEGQPWCRTENERADRHRRSSRGGRPTDFDARGCLPPSPDAIGKVTGLLAPGGSSADLGACYEVGSAHRSVLWVSMRALMWVSASLTGCGSSRRPSRKRSAT